MALPKNNLPVYTLTIPSTNKQLKYRPFVVKDEKALLIAQQSKDEQVMLDTLKQVIQSCSITDIDIESLATLLKTKNYSSSFYHLPYTVT